MITMATRHSPEKKRLIAYRKEGTVIRIEKPTKLPRARALGYKAKQGFAVARVRVPMGRRKRPLFKGGRRPKTRGRFFALDKSKQQVAEEKASRKFTNMEVLNSYLVGKDGVHKWFEVILIDRTHPVIVKSPLAANTRQRGRAFRGLTSSGKKTRGLVRS